MSQFFVITEIKALKLILVFSLINSSIFVMFHPREELRVIIVILLLLSVLLLFISFIKLIKYTFILNNYFKVTILLLLTWSIFVFTRGLTFDFKNLISLFGHYMFGWSWLTPMAFIFGLQLKNWTLLLDFTCKLLVVGLFLTIFALVESKIYSGALNWLELFPLILFTFYYQSKSNRNVVIFSIFAFLIVAYILSSRVSILLLLICFILFIHDYLHKTKHVFYKYAIVIVIIFFITVLLVNYSTNILLFEIGSQQLSSDTRSFLFIELFDDLSNWELFIGRGALGTYYSPHFNMLIENSIEGGDWFDRQTIEVGYLQMILKGGFVMVVLNLIILIPAAYLGIYKSNNFISKMCGYYILLYIFLLAVSFPPAYMANFLLLWMAVGTVIANYNRELTNFDVVNLKIKTI